MLAIGFGLEPSGPGRSAYWNDADKLDGLPANASVLVSGFGDGGLADVLRLCLPGIRQDRLVELVRRVPSNIERKLIDWERQYQKNPGELDKWYNALKVEDVQEVLGEEVEAGKASSAKVTLVGRGHLYGPGSAILNRFLVSQLHQAAGDVAFRLENEPIKSGSLQQTSEGRYSVRFGEDGPERMFDRVVLRFGPEPAYRHVAPLPGWAGSEERRLYWRDMPQSMDQTRVPLWPEWAASRQIGKRPDFLAYESSLTPWCLIVRPAISSVEWIVHTRLALKAIEDDRLPLKREPLVLCADMAMADPAAMRDAVRAMCVADIMIIDVSFYDPAVMMLLGIRAVVRRSVTIVCTKEERTATLWEELPFNLKELNLISFHNEEAGNKELTAALRAGLKQASMSSRYLDLPVYDYVRDDSTEAAPGDPSWVLLLRAFKSYNPARKLYLEDQIRSSLHLTKDSRVESVIDQISPRLAGQRLYEAIRHWHTCVTDLTLWRPNVLFELGVRLAVRPTRTFCLIDPSAEGDMSFQGSRALLKDLLHPIVYSLGPAKLKFTEPVSSFVYDAAAQHFRIAQDRVPTPLYTLLGERAAATSGYDDPLQAVDARPLFARDRLAYGNELRQFAFENVCAAWCYLVDREAPHEILPIDLLDPHHEANFRRFQSLSSRLKTELGNRHSRRDKDLQARVEKAEAAANATGVTALADLLREWKQIRGERVWQTAPADVVPEDKDTLIADCEYQLDVLAQLKSQLKKLNGPAGIIPLQGVRSDAWQIGSILRKLKADAHD